MNSDHGLVFGGVIIPIPDDNYIHFSQDYRSDFGQKHALSLKKKIFDTFQLDDFEKKSSRE